MILQIDKEIGEGVIDGVDAIGFLGLLDDGVDVGDFRDGFEDPLLLAVVESALLLGLLDHLVMVLHEGAAEPRLLVLTHLRREEILTLEEEKTKNKGPEHAACRINPNPSKNDSSDDFGSISRWGFGFELCSGGEQEEGSNEFVPADHGFTYVCGDIRAVRFGPQLDDPMKM